MPKKTKVRAEKRRANPVYAKDVSITHCRSLRPGDVQKNDWVECSASGELNAAWIACGANGLVMMERDYVGR